MNTTISTILSKSMVSIAVVLTLSASPSSVEPVQASNGGKATNVRVNGQTAVFYLDDGDRYALLTVTRDEIANTTLLSYGYRFPDPNDSNLSILILGDEGEIPNNAFTVNSTSAHLALTTPDSYPVTRCVIDNYSGEYTCAPTAPSTFDLTWTEDGYRSFHETGTRVETLGQVTTRVRGRFDEVTAHVSGMWDGHSGTNMSGFLIDSENATLFREIMMEATPQFITLLALQARVEATRMQRARVNGREAFSLLEGAGLNGLVRVMRDEITNTTILRFGYAFPDPNAPATLLFFEGLGEIPNSAFTVTSASARLTVTTPDAYPITRCVIIGVIGDPGAITCAPATTPLTFDLTWIKDGYGSVHETGTSVEIVGPVTTRYHRQYNQVTANVLGTWNESNGHAGTNMTGYLFNFQDATIDETNP